MRSPLISDSFGSANSQYLTWSVPKIWTKLQIFKIGRFRSCEIIMLLENWKVPCYKLARLQNCRVARFQSRMVAELQGSKSSSFEIVYLQQRNAMDWLIYFFCLVTLLASCLNISPPKAHLSNECLQETSYFRSKQIFWASNLDSIPTLLCFDLFVCKHWKIKDSKQITIICPTKDHSLHGSFLWARNSWPLGNIPMISTL